MKGQYSLFDELVIDSFAGGGGASTGIELAMGGKGAVDIAINHDPAAIAMHQQNHPFTRHYCESVWDVDPKTVTGGHPVALCWFSPDCKHFSRAKGGKPRNKNIRGLAWVALKWAATVKPRCIILENVPEFTTWCPLDKDGYPVKGQEGRTFRSFINALKRQGYEVEYKELRACDYGAPTIRTRFFLIARCDGKKIVWPKATHGEGLGLKPYRTAAECIDFDLPTKSIFEREKPLAENTMKRIANGLVKFVLKNPDPFIVSTKTEDGRQKTANALLLYHSEKQEGECRGQNPQEPLKTIDTNPRFALSAAFLSPYYAGGYTTNGRKLTEPLPTVTAIDHNCLVEVNFTACEDGMLEKRFLTEYYGTGKPLSVDQPFHTQTSKDRNALTVVKMKRAGKDFDQKHWPKVRAMLNRYCGYSLADDEILLLPVDGQLYFISDVRFRMLTPRELYNAQGFPEDYIIDFDVNGKSYSKKEQIARCGNSVPPPFARALVSANLPELCSKHADRIKTMEQLTSELAM